MTLAENRLGSFEIVLKWSGILLLCFVLNLIPEGTLAQQSAPVLTLEQSIEIALERNLGIRLAIGDIVAAREQKKEARTNFLPKFFAEYGWYHPSETTISFAGQTIQNQDDNRWSFDGTIEQPIFTGFSILSNFQLAQLGLDVAQIQLNRARLDLILQVKEVYFGILRAEKLVEVSEQSVRELQEGVRVAKNFVKVGLRPKVDLLDAETRLAQAELELIRDRNTLQLAIARFNTVLRRPINTSVAVEDVLSTETYRRTYMESESIALRHRPEIQEAEKNVISAAKEVTLAKSDYYPTVTWSLNYHRRGDDPTVDGSEFSDREFWDTTAVARWTLFEWGRTRYAVSQQRARLRQAEDTLEQVQDSVRLEVKSAFLTLQAAEEAIRVAQKSVESAEENFRISQERYREQVATSTEVLDAQTRLTQAKTDYTNALVIFNLARARLIRAMGLTVDSG
jgi:outer membrane protein